MEWSALHCTRCSLFDKGVKQSSTSYNYPKIKHYTIPANNRNPALAIGHLASHSHVQYHFAPALFRILLGRITTLSPLDKLFLLLTILRTVRFVNLIEVIRRQRHQRLWRTLKTIFAILFGKVYALLSFSFGDQRVKIIMNMLEFYHGTVIFKEFFNTLHLRTLFW